MARLVEFAGRLSPDRFQDAQTPLECFCFPGVASLTQRLGVPLVSLPKQGKELLVSLNIAQLPFKRLDRGRKISLGERLSPLPQGALDTQNPWQILFRRCQGLPKAKPGKRQHHERKSQPI